MIMLTMMTTMIIMLMKMKVCSMITTRIRNMTIIITIRIRNLTIMSERGKI